MASSSNMQAYRNFLKDVCVNKLIFSQTDQSLGIAPPPIEKSFEHGSQRITLAAPEKTTIPAFDLLMRFNTARAIANSDMPRLAWKN